MRFVSHSGNILLLEREAAKAIHTYFGVGRADYPPNRVEQGGWLVGTYISDHPGCVQGVVTHFLPAYRCVGTASYLHWPAEENLRLQREFFKLQQQLEREDPVLAGSLCRLGWIHSHPNSLPVFLSDTDLANIRDHFNSYNQFSVVLNPHSQQWKAFLGPDTAAVPAVMFSSPEPQASSPKEIEAKPEKPASDKKNPYRKAVYGKAPGGKRRKRGKKGR